MDINNNVIIITKEIRVPPLIDLAFLFTLATIRKREKVNFTINFISFFIVVNRQLYS